MKEEKRAGIRDNLEIMLYFLKLTYRIYPLYLPTLFGSSFFKALTPFINIVLPKFIIDELLGAQRREVFIALILAIITANFLLNLINKWFEGKVAVVNERLFHQFDLVVSEKIVDMDFENIEDPQILDLKERATFAIYNEGAVFRLVENLATMVSTLFSILGLVSIILTLNPLLLIIILSMIALNSRFFKIIQQLHYHVGQKSIPGNRAFGYFGTLTSDFSLGKDIRLYQIAPIFHAKVRRFTNEIVALNSKHYRTVGSYTGLTHINLQVQMTLVYGYLVYSVLRGTIGIGDFTLYAGAATTFCTSVSTLIGIWIESGQHCRHLELFQEFEGLPSKGAKGNRSLPAGEQLVIRFQNVSFRYPRSSKDTLKNVSLTLHPGEKLSVVGLNGAGKTTFIKLLTRLYEPTEGAIYLNDININEFEYGAYMDLLSVVFQDFKLLSFSIKENITTRLPLLDREENLKEVLEKAGFGPDLDRLEQGLETPVYKQFDKKGVEFSGGQSQKLAIARALYKNAPIVVLDEPTAALDPISEFEIYSRFNDLVGQKTAIYISHRLSSCRFCDRIAVFNQGELVEYGTHDELLQKQRSLYGEMYQAQAQYYV